MVYLNDTADWRTDTSIINFEHEILGVYSGWDQTLYFDSSRFASNYYPVYGNSNSQSNFQLRRFDPFNWNNGSANSTWYNYDASNVGDWFSTGNSNTSLYVGFGNDNQQGDFIRVFTRSFVCTGSINGAADDYSICRDATAQFSVDTIIPGYTYSWSPTTGLSNPNIHNPIATVSSNTTYTVTATNTYCTYTDTVGITILQTPTVNVGSDTAYCEGDAISIDANVTSPYSSASLSYLWTTNAVLDTSNWVSYTTEDVSVTSSSGTDYIGDYILTVTNPLGCSSADTTFINVNSIFVSAAANSATICKGQSTVITANGADTYTWTPGISLSDSATNAPTASPQTTTTYLVTGTQTSTGCVASFPVTVTINCLDTDGDGITDDNDIDDDNDGITDVEEGFDCTTPTRNIYGEWVGSDTLRWRDHYTVGNYSQSSGDDPVATNPVINVNGTQITLSRSTSGVLSNNLVTEEYRVNVSEPPDNNNADQAVYTIYQLASSNGVSSHTFNFDPPIYNLAFDLHDVDQENNKWKDYCVFTITTSDGYAHNLNASEYSKASQTYITPNTFEGASPVFQNNGDDISIDGLQSYISSIKLDYSNTEPPTSSYQVVSFSNMVFCPTRDTDQDGIPDHLDVDADNDGIYDVVEGGDGAQDTNNDGVIDSNDTGFTDADNDGMADNAEATAPIDTDGDNIGDFLEIDSDGDGCTDLVEAGYTDGEGDGILGSNPVTVNEVGKVTSGTDGYTNPLDNDGNSTFDFQEVNSNLSSTVDTVACQSLTWNGNTYTESGTYYWYSESPGGGCDSVVTLNLILRADSVNVQALPELVCSGSSTTLTASGGSSYSWNTGETTASITVSPTDTTTYTVDIEQHASCTATIPITVNTLALPSVSAGSDNSVCIGSSFNLSATGASTYLWTPTATLSDSAIANPVATPTTNTTYVVAGTDANGCTNTDTITISINALPTINAGNDTVLCVGDTLQLNGSGGSTYSWSPSTGISNANIASPYLVVSANETFTLTGTDANGCQNTDQITVTANQVPGLNVLGLPAIICNGSASIAYASAGDGQFTYLWEDGSTSQSINVAPTQTTTYSVTVTGPNGCSSKGSVTITVEPNNLTADIGGDRALCLGDSLNFDALISGCTPSTTINSELFASSSYGTSRTNFSSTPTGFWQNVSGDDEQWFGESNATSTSGTGPNAPNSGNDYIYFDARNGSTNDVAYLESGTISSTNVVVDFYYFMYGFQMGILELQYYDGTFWNTIWSQSGQQQTSGSAPWTNQEVDLTGYAVTKLRFVATKGSGTRSDIALDDITVTDPGSGCVFTWTTNSSNGTSGWSATDTEDIIATSSVATSYAGEYYLKVENTIGCEAFDTASITVNPVPTANAGSDVTICEGSTTQLSASGADSYSWSPTTGLSNPSVNDPIASPSTTTTYTVTATNSYGCPDTDQVTVNVIPYAVSVNNDTTICSTDVISLTASGAVSYVWSTSETTPSISVSPTTQTTYTVVATDSYGCISTDSVVVSVNALPTVSINNGVNPEICIGDSTDLAVTGAVSYTWSTGYNSQKYVVSKAVYQGASEDLYVGSQESEPTGVSFNNDGTKMFVIGFDNDYINEYNLSTAFDVSTASFAGNSERFRVRNIEQWSTDLKFNNDGTKMFTIGDEGDAVDEFTLSTAFDVSTAMHAGNNESFSVRSQEGRPQGFAFNNDGTKMYVVGFGSDFVYEYNLTTAFDVSTATYAGNSERLDVSGEDGASNGLNFNSDGTIMYVLGRSTDRIYQYALSTAFDVSTGVYSGINQSYLVTQDQTPQDLIFNNDGSKMYVVGSG